MGKPKDLLLAYQYYQLASNYNLPQANYQLGVMNEFGQGTSQDLETAQEYYQRAANQGNIDAKMALQKLPIKEPDDLEILASN